MVRAFFPLLALASAAIALTPEQAGNLLPRHASLVKRGDTAFVGELIRQLGSDAVSAVSDDGDCKSQCGSLVDVLSQCGSFVSGNAQFVCFCSENSLDAYDSCGSCLGQTDETAAEELSTMCDRNEADLVSASSSLSAASEFSTTPYTYTGTASTLASMAEPLSSTASPTSSDSSTSDAVSPSATDADGNAASLAKSAAAVVLAGAVAVLAL
ncbi:hypothetical protein JCM8547_008995 [Rhodosporidiobolus lusitaniae]